MEYAMSLFSEQTQTTRRVFKIIYLVSHYNSADFPSKASIQRLALFISSSRTTISAKSVREHSTATDFQPDTRPGCEPASHQRS